MRRIKDHFDEDADLLQGISLDDLREKYSKLYRTYRFFDEREQAEIYKVVAPYMKPQESVASNREMAQGLAEDAEKISH